MCSPGIGTNPGVNSKALGSKSTSTRLLCAFWALLLVLSFLCAPTQRSSAQKAAAIPALPPADLSAVPPVEIGPVATIGDARSSVRTQSRGGKFRLTGIRERQTVNVRLQFSPQFAGTSFSAMALDGGETIVPGQNSVIAPDGTTSMLFKAGDQPGLYRVLVIGGGNRSILKFWVADSKNPQNNPPVLKPGNQE